MEGERTRWGGKKKNHTGQECVNLGVNEICVGLPNKPPSRYQLCPMQMRALAHCHGFAAGDLCVCVCARKRVRERERVSV